MITKINSKNNEQIKNIYKQTRDKNAHFFVIESLNLIKDIIDDNKDIDIILTTESFFSQNPWLKRISNIIITNQLIINKIAFTISPPACIGIKKLQIKTFVTKPNDNYLILDKIQDPGNLATIIRTAIAFNIKKLFLSKNSISPYNDKVLRSTMGAIFQIKINYYNDLMLLIHELEKNNIECLATCLNKEAILLNNYYPKKQYHAIILGNESKGISQEILDHLKNKIYIPINNINSLNVAIAASIVIYQKWLWDQQCKK